MPFPDPSVDYYAVLGVDRLATIDEIREAARKKSKEWHPDRRPGDAGAEARMSLINDARSVLEDSALRDRYDRDRAPFRLHRAGLYAPGPGPGVVVDFIPTARDVANRTRRGEPYRDMSLPEDEAAVLVEERPEPLSVTIARATVDGFAVARADRPVRRTPYRARRALVIGIVLAAGVAAAFSGALATRRSGSAPGMRRAVPPATLLRPPSSLLVPPPPPAPSMITDEQVQLEPGSKADTVSCNSADVCVAVDPLAATSYQFTSGSWGGPVPIPIAVGPETRGLSCPTPRFCALLTSLGAIATYDGATWTVDATGLSGARALSCSSARMCVAVGVNGPVMAFDGNEWSALGPPSAGDKTPSELVAVSCPAGIVCVGVDEHGLTYTDVDRHWRLAAVLPTSSGSVDSLACRTASSCVAAAEGVLWKFDGSAWSSLVPPYGGGRDLFVSVSCTGNGTCTAVGARGELVTITGAGVTQPQVVDTYGLRSVSCGTPTLCAAADAGSGLLTFALSPSA